jgi:Holliday junction resolvase RusA-like endonuclease
MTTPPDAIAFTLRGEPASKANSRKIVTLGGKPAVIRSAKARDYERIALAQIPAWARQRIQGPVGVSIRIWYASERPDLDESVILDVLQDRYARAAGLSSPDRTLLAAGVYRNDRQVREKHIYHSIDKVDPRSDIKVWPLQGQQKALI